MVMIICPDCGKEQDNLNKFCRNCGADLSKVEVVEETEDSSQLVVENSDSPQDLTDDSASVSTLESNDDVSVSSHESNVDASISTLESNDLAEVNVEEKSEDTAGIASEDTAGIASEDTAGIASEVTASIASEANDDVAPVEKPQVENIGKCSDCGTEIGPNVKFCPNCGKSTKDLIKTSSVKFCPSCGAELDSNIKFCPTCGFNLDQLSIKPKPTVTKVSEKKTPILSVILSFIFPGLGQFYNGQGTKGLYFIIMAVVSWILCLIVIGIVLYILVWVWSIFDAYKSAEAINRGEILEDKLF